MKKIDFISNILRFSLKEVVVLLLLIGVIGYGLYVEDTILSFGPKNKTLQVVKAQKIEENESYNYVEDILEEHYENLQKFKSIKAPDLFGFQEEIEGLIPRGIQIEETKINSEEFMIRGLSPNLRTIDFLISILNTYNNYYGGFNGEVVLVNTTKKDTLFSFRIKGEIDANKIINKVYTGDMDGDGVVDSTIEEVINSSGVKQTKSIIQDYCPFTPSFNIVIGQLIESNPQLVKTYPYYNESFKKGHFSFDSETGCLNSGDTEITFGNEE